MTFAEIKAAIERQPLAEREFWRWAFEFTFDDGFMRGAARCSRQENPFLKPQPVDEPPITKRR